MVTIAKSQIVISAPGGKPTQLEVEFFVGHAPRHHQDAVAIPGMEFAQVLQDFLGIENRAHHKLELILTAGHQRLNHMRRVASRVMLSNPFFGRVACWGRVAEFGADRPQVALAIPIDCSCRFDGDVFVHGFESLAQFPEVFEDHRLAAGENHMSDLPTARRIEDGGHGHGVPFGIPGCVARVAEPATKIAAAGADEDTRCPRKKPFPLDAPENLRNTYHSQGSVRELGSCHRKAICCNRGGLLRYATVRGEPSCMRPIGGQCGVNGRPTVPRNRRAIQQGCPTVPPDSATKPSQGVNAMSNQGSYSPLC